MPLIAHLYGCMQNWREKWGQFRSEIHFHLIYSGQSLKQMKWFYLKDINNRVDSPYLYIPGLHSGMWGLIEIHWNYMYKECMWGGIFVCLQSSLFFWFALSSLLCFHLHELASVCVCFMGMRATESLQKKHICLWVIRWVIVLLLSVRESSLPCPPKVWAGIKESWQLQSSCRWMWEQALQLLAEITPPFPSFLRLKTSLEASRFSSALYWLLQPEASLL